MSAIEPSRTFERTLSVSLSGVKRTWRLQCEMSAYDPKRTYGEETIPSIHFIGRGMVAQGVGEGL